MTHENVIQTVSPRLVLRDVDAATDYYVDVFRARRGARFVDPTGIVVHATIELGGLEISMAQEVTAWRLLAPDSLGGSAVLLSLTLDDPDAVAARAVARGGAVLVPIQDRPYGIREGRVRDPFGHLWVLRKVIEQLDEDEMQRRLTAAMRSAR